MRRLLPLMMLLILAAMAVRTQQPSPYYTNDSPNGLWWRGMSPKEKISFMAGVNSGSVSTVLELVTALYYEPVCQGMLTTANESREKPYTKYTNGDLIREIDAFYNDGANISLPTRTALSYARMKLGGATKRELDEYLKEVR